MHELHRAQAILDTMTRDHVDYPVEITLAHLTTTQITLEEVVECFDIVTEGTALKGSTIKFIGNDTILQCKECGEKHVVTREHVPTHCSKCNSEKLFLDDDDELTLLSYSKL